MKAAWIAAALALSACASAPNAPPPAPDQGMADLIASGGRLQGAALEAALDRAATQPLGGRANPVRAEMPQGQRAYLARLRCSDGTAPVFQRVGNVGPGPFGSIIDHYDVRCPAGSPARTDIYMDIYFPGYRESTPVEGFLLAPLGS